jgi:hypothetical protein
VVELGERGEMGWDGMWDIFFFGFRFLWGGGYSFLVSKRKADFKGVEYRKRHLWRLTRDRRQQWGREMGDDEDADARGGGRSLLWGGVCLIGYREVVIG